LNPAMDSDQAQYTVTQFRIKITKDILGEAESIYFQIIKITPSNP
jgi:hypothetical protein